MKIKKYDPLIYPINIYIGIDENINSLLEGFTDSNTRKPLYDNWNNSDGLVYSEILDSNNEFCLLMVFEKEPSISLVVHELSHITYRLWEHIGEKEMGNEANAYLQEWIMKCYLDYLTEYKNTINDTSVDN